MPKRDPTTGKPTTFYTDGKRAFDALTGPTINSERNNTEYQLRRIFDAMIAHACRATKDKSHG